MNEDLVLGLPADAYRNKILLDWIIANKDNEGELSQDYNQLLTERFIKRKSIQSNALATLSQTGVELA